jgi:hypothetical protein
MEFHLNLTIRGLCAFVPMETFIYGERQMLRGMKVLVVDAQKPRTITERTKEPLNLCGHIPELRLPEEVLPLTDHRIEIHGIDPGLPLLVEPSFGRMAQIERAAPGAGRIQSRFLQRDPSEGLVANLDLISGTVETLAPRREELVFQPDLVSPPYSGHFTSMVHVQMVIHGDEAVLCGIPVRGGSGFERPVRPKPGGDSVEVFLVNTCPPSAHHGRGDLESDFAAFYDLSDEYKGLISIPETSAGPDVGRGMVPGEASFSPACVTGGFPTPLGQ